MDRNVLVDTASASDTAHARDVSAGGISVETALSLEVGSVVDVYFELPIGFAIETRGRVVRSERGVAALRFVDLPRESVIALRSFCRLSGLHTTASFATALAS